MFGREKKGAMIRSGKKAIAVHSKRRKKGMIMK